MSLLSAAQRQLPCQLPTIKQAAVKGNSHICDLPDGGSLPLPMRFQSVSTRERISSAVSVVMMVLLYMCVSGVIAMAAPVYKCLNVTVTSKHDMESV